MNSNEKPVIMVVVTLFLALILVYVIYFRVQSSRSTENNLSGSLVTQSGSQFASTDFGSSTNQDNSDFVNVIDVQGGANGLKVDGLSSFDFRVKDLAIYGIKPRYSELSIAQQLGLSIDTAFVDKDRILYGYLGTGAIDTLADTVRRLGGNVVAIETRNDIMSNNLRGDRVLFINIPGTTFVQQPTEQRLLVAIIVMIGDDRRFIQSPIDQYYAHKNDMKSYFEHFYNRTR